jgi:DNA helicase II / ATP-dependent DNA helicase PcrA
MLNSEQLKAAAPGTGAVLLLAGAGSGKTTTLIERVKNTLAAGLCRPEQILIMTFSRKSAEEIRDRAGAGLGTGGTKILAGTFHSMALSVLREFSEKVCTRFSFVKFPAILDGDKREKIFSDLFQPVKQEFLGLPFPLVMQMITSDRFAVIDELCEPVRRFKQIYQDVKKRESLIDFDDIISYASELVSEDRDVQHSVRSAHPFIFADEYQDVSDDIFRFLSACTGSQGNLFAVGDDRQSIYGFRGAEIGYMLDFKGFYPDAKILHLSNNFRSYKEIVSLSDCFIARNRRQNKRTSLSPKGSGGNVQSVPVLSEKAEFAAIRKMIADSKDGSTAVLFRNNWQGDRIKRYLDANGSVCNHVTLMTVHASKGLEFDNVIISGVDDKIFPSPRTPLEEERRLFYVAITRARKNLCILYKPDKENVPLFVKESSMSSGWMIRHPISAARDTIMLKRALRQTETTTSEQENLFRQMT